MGAPLALLGSLPAQAEEAGNADWARSVLEEMSELFAGGRIQIGVGDGCPLQGRRKGD